jgi:hypothetical protein
MSNRERVEQFLENKESYKVKSRNTFAGGDKTPKDQGSDLDPDVSKSIGGFIYGFIAEGYAPGTTKQNYQDFDLETPADFNDFLTKGVGNEGAKLYNQYVDSVAASLERAFDSNIAGGQNCKSYNERYGNVESGMPDYGSLNFCSGQVTDDQLEFFLQNEAKRILENTLTTSELFKEAGVDGLSNSDNVYQMDPDEFNSEENQQKREELRKKASETSSAIAEDAFNASVYGRIDPRYQEQCFLLTHALTFAKIKMDMDENGWINEDGQRVYNKTYPYYGEDAGGSLAGSNSSILSHYDPFAYINRLTQSGAKEYLFDAPSSALSALQPMIRLYKIIAEKQDDGSTIEREVEINFDSYATQNDLSKLENKANRGFGAGIRSFDFKCNASNPFSIKKSISAKLVIFANNFGELYRDREGIAISTNNQGQITYTDVKYKYLDLALKTGDEDTFDYQRGGVDPRDANAAIYDATKLNFRLKAVVGWANPKASGASTSNGVGTGTINSGLLSAIYDSYITLNLTPTIHDFDIDELGRVTFSLNYLAYVEDFFDQPEYNIFTDLDPTISQITRRIKQAEANQKCDSQTVAATKGNETEIKAIEAEKEANLRSLINSMVNYDKIRVFDIDIEELGKYKNAGPLIELDGAQVEEFRKKITVGNEDAIPPDTVDPKLGDASELSAAGSILHGGGYGKGAADTRTGIPPAPKATFGNVAFFYVSDLIDVILRNQSVLFAKLPNVLGDVSNIDGALLKEQVSRYQRHQENFKRFRVLLGPLELVKATKVKIEGEKDPPAKIETAIVNLGDLPISVKYFMEFMTEKMLKTDREVYPIGSFLNQFFNTFISDFLNTDNCFGGRTSQKVRLFQIQ